MLSYGLGSRQIHAGMTNLDDFLKPHFSTTSNARIAIYFALLVVIVISYKPANLVGGRIRYEPSARFDHRLSRWFIKQNQIR